MIDWINFILSFFARIVAWMDSVFLVEGVSLLSFSVACILVPGIAFLVVKKAR